MATLVLAVAGSLIAGPIGGAVGAVIGAAIDKEIMDATGRPIRRGKLDEVRAGGAEEGDPIPWISGPRCRVDGQIIWTSSLREVRHNSGSGMFNGPRVINYSYFIDVAIAFTRRQCESLSRLWLGSQLIYSNIAGPSLTSTSISITAQNETHFTGSYWDEQAQQYVPLTTTYRLMLIDHSGPNNALSVFAAGGTITVSGAANAANNGTWDVWAVSSDVDGILGKSRIKVLRCSYTSIAPNPSCTPGVSAAAGPSITLSQSAVPLLPGHMDTFTFYPGNGTQNPDPTIEAALGSGNAPAYRGLCYIVCKNLNVTKLSGSLPTFSAEIKQSNTKNVGELITELCQLSGQLTDVDAIDVTGLTDEVYGYVTTGIFSPLQELNNVLLGYCLDRQEQGRTLKFFRRADAEIIDIDDADRGAREEGGDAPRLLSIEPRDLSKMPQEMVVEASDVNRDLQSGTRSYRRTSNPLNNTQRVTLAFTTSARGMQQLAMKLLWAEHSAYETIKLQVPLRNIEILEGDVIRVNDAMGNQHVARVRECDRGALNGLIKIEATSTDLGVFTQSITVDAGDEDDAEDDPPLPSLTLPPTVKLMVLDLPPLIDTVTELGGFVFAAGSFETSSLQERWVGCRVYWSRNGTDWRVLYETTERAVTGVATTVLGDVASNATWDYENTVTVVLDNDDDELVSMDEEEVLATGQNMLLVGGEIIQFVTATLTGPRTYVLSQLRRGCRGTERLMGSHGVASGVSPWDAGVWDAGVWDDGVWGEGVEALNEWVVLLSGPGVVFREIAGSHNAPLLFRAVPPAIDPDEAVDEVSAVSSSLSRAAFPVYAVRATRNSDGDLTVTWAPRSRSPIRTLSGEAAPSDEAVESYIVEVRDSTDAEVVATYRASPYVVGSSFNYTAAQQMVDYGSAQSELRIRIYQTSRFRGRGVYRSVVV